MASLACAIYAVIFLKLWSYLQVNYWCRLAASNRPQALAKHARHPSLADLPTNSSSASSSAAASAFTAALGGAAGNKATFPSLISFAQKNEKLLEIITKMLHIFRKASDGLHARRREFWQWPRAISG